jgi:hypothetical protein
MCICSVEMKIEFSGVARITQFSTYYYFKLPSTPMLTGSRVQLLPAVLHRTVYDTVYWGGVYDYMLPCR